MSPDEILDQIDHALEDWEVGPDAMRWTPDPPANQLSRVVVGFDGAARGGEATLVISDEAQQFSWGPVLEQLQAAWRDELLRAAFAAYADLAAAADRLTATLAAGSIWVDTITAEICAEPPPRQTDRFTLNDWAVSGPASETQRALIREATE